MLCLIHTDKTKGSLPERWQSFSKSEVLLRTEIPQNNMADISKIVDELSGLTVLQIADLVKTLEEKWGVSAAAPVAVAAAGPAGAAAPAAEAQTEFDVILADGGAQKIAVIKEIRTVVAGLGLAEAKALVDKPGSVIKSGANKAEADEIKKKLEAAGAKVEIK
jgi:large subunit ribosomal protein L7/L12